MRRQIRWMLSLITLVIAVSGAALFWKQGATAVATDATPIGGVIADRSPMRFIALDGGRPVVSSVYVSALAATPDGTVYAGGSLLTTVRAKGTATPSGHPSPLGSAFIVSHDHGRTWSVRSAMLGQFTGSIFGRDPDTSWTDRTRWPSAFIPNTMTVDPTHSRTLYAAGCVHYPVVSDPPLTCNPIESIIRPTQSGGMVRMPPVVLRSTDGGRIWQDAITLSYAANPTTGQITHFASNIVASPALLQALLSHRALSTLYDPVVPFQSFSVAIDPHDNQRLFACLSNLGLLRSDDGGRTWRYLPGSGGAWIGQNQDAAIAAGTFVDNVLVDPQDDHVVNDLNHFGALRASTDDGMHWALLVRFDHPPYPQPPPFDGELHVGEAAYLRPGAEDLTEVRGALYITLGSGIYASTDQGRHWRLALSPPGPDGAFIASIGGREGWIGFSIPKSYAEIKAREGLYAARDGGPWCLVARDGRDGENPNILGSMDVWHMAFDQSVHIWDDGSTGIMFATSPTGGLLRWTSNV